MTTLDVNTKKYHVFAPMGRFQLESIRCVYYLSEITKRTSNLKKNIAIVFINHQSNPPKRPQSAVGTLF